MKIVFCSAEVFPFSKTGGLADVSNALPKALEKRGHEIIILTPLYSFIEHNFSLNQIEKEYSVLMGEKEEKFTLYETFLPNSSVKVLFVKHPYFYRETIYVNQEGKEFEDNPIRYIFLSRAIAEITEKYLPSSDILHVNDWHTALVPFILNTEHSNYPNTSKIKILFNIHNIGYQGIYDKERVSNLGINNEYFTDDHLGFYNRINYMKGGILYSDAIATVSKTYSKEIQTDDYGFGLQTLLKERQDQLFGIINGVDYEIWNPKTDPYIAINYDSTTLENKKICKEELQKELGLEISSKPLIAVISRLDYQKGLNLLIEKFDDIMNLDIQLVLLGTGSAELEKNFKLKGGHYPKDCSIKITFDAVLSHKIEAGADMFLMPSRYEPCGLNQMYSMIYGTVPIVRNVGGLADTVMNYNSETEEGTGFSFDKFNANEFYNAIKRAVQVYTEKEKWTRLVQKIMNIDFSWEKRAEEWEQFYLQTKEQVDQAKLSVVIDDGFEEEAIDNNEE